MAQVAVLRQPVAMPRELGDPMSTMPHVRLLVGDRVPQDSKLALRMQPSTILLCYSCLFCVFSLLQFSRAGCVSGSPHVHRSQQHVMWLSYHLEKTI
jgi:hypothetical protein